MEAEIEDHHQPQSSLLRIPRFSSSSSSPIVKESESNENLQYTSLKDIICNTPTRYSTLFYEGNEAFDSNIAIRNELVKRAASVYLHSAALLATRNQNCFLAFWEKIKSRAASCSCRIGACLWPIFQFLNHIMGTFRSLQEEQPCRFCSFPPRQPQ